MVHCLVAEEENVQRHVPFELKAQTTIGASERAVYALNLETKGSFNCRRGLYCNGWQTDRSLQEHNHQDLPKSVVCSETLKLARNENGSAHKRTSCSQTPLLIFLSVFNTAPIHSLQYKSQRLNRGNRGLVSSDILFIKTTPCFALEFKKQLARTAYRRLIETLKRHLRSMNQKSSTHNNIYGQKHSKESALRHRKK